MTPVVLNAIRRRLGLSAAALARELRLGRNGGRSVRRWEDGMTISGPVAIAMEALGRGADRVDETPEYVIATDPEGAGEYVIRLHPPGFIARVDPEPPDGAIEDIEVIAWLDPPPEDWTEAMRLLRTAASALEIYTQDSAEAQTEPQPNLANSAAADRSGKPI